VNFDGIIADFNVVHCAEAGDEGSPLDIEYLDTLGTAALPALDHARDSKTVKLPPWRLELAGRVSTHLHEKLVGELADWRSWTWRRERSATDVDRTIARLHTSHNQPLAQATPVNPTQ
jgi:hypothetical protein